MKGCREEPFEGSAIRIDLAYAEKDASGFRTNVSVIREQPAAGADARLLAVGLTGGS